MNNRKLYRGRRVDTTDPPVTPQIQRAADRYAVNLGKEFGTVATGRRPGAMGARAVRRMLDAKCREQNRKMRRSV